MGAHSLAYYVSDQSNNHHDNTDVNNKDDSQSFETPRGNYCSSTSFGDTIVTVTT